MTCSLDQAPNSESTNSDYFFTKFAVCFDQHQTDFCLRIKIDKKANLQLFENKQTRFHEIQFRIGFVVLGLGVGSDEQVKKFLVNFKFFRTLKYYAMLL